MEVIVDRPAALDVHKEQVTACVLVPAADGTRSEEVVQFQTTVRGLLTLHDWLEAHRVGQVAMEARGVFWRPVWAVLEDDFELLAGERAPGQAGPRAEDRSLGCGLALSAAGGGAVAGE